MKADLAIYAHVLAVPGQYESVALMLSYKMNFHCRANRSSFCKSSHVLHMVLVLYCYAYTVFQLLHMQWFNSYLPSVFKLTFKINCNQSALCPQC